MLRRISMATQRSLQRKLHLQLFSDSGFHAHCTDADYSNLVRVRQLGNEGLVAWPVLHSEVRPFSLSLYSRLTPFQAQTASNFQLSTLPLSKSSSGPALPQVICNPQHDAQLLPAHHVGPSASKDQHVWSRHLCSQICLALSRVAPEAPISPCRNMHAPGASYSGEHSTGPTARTCLQFWGRCTCCTLSGVERMSWMTRRYASLRDKFALLGRQSMQWHPR